jgi:hypothetical protein
MGDPEHTKIIIVDEKNHRVAAHSHSQIRMGNHGEELETNNSWELFVIIYTYYLEVVIDKEILTVNESRNIIDVS